MIILISARTIFTHQHVYITVAALTGTLNPFISYSLSCYLQGVDKSKLKNELMCSGRTVYSAKMVSDELFNLT